MATLLQFPAQPATEDRSRQSGSTALKARKTGFSLWIKSLQAVGLAVVVCFSLGATDPGARFNDLGHRMMCTCSCAQLLGECNHVGCSFSGQMRQELSAAIAGGSSDKEILASFSTKYGPDGAGCSDRPRLRPGRLDRSFRGLGSGPGRDCTADPPLGCQLHWRCAGCRGRRTSKSGPGSQGSAR